MSRAEQEVIELVKRGARHGDMKRVLARHGLGSAGMPWKRQPCWGQCGICGKQISTKQVLCSDHRGLAKGKHRHAYRLAVQKYVRRKNRLNATKLKRAATSVIRSAEHFYLKSLGAQ